MLIASVLSAFRIAAPSGTSLPLAAALLVLVAACTPVTRSASSPPDTFVVPTAPPETAEPKPLPGASYKNPRIATEVQQAFELIYHARSLARGARFDVEGLRGFVQGPYADYTLPLFDREIRDAAAGVLQQVSFRDIAVRLEQWFPDSETAVVTVTRTRIELRAGAAPTNETATYQFRMRRGCCWSGQVGPDSIYWVVYDFLNPASGKWISESSAVSDLHVSTELKSFFNEFYEARTLSPGHPLDLSRSAGLVAGSYKAYTLPLLARSQAEAESGTLTDVRYAGISVRLESWDPAATDHGGIALVAVTRTALVGRPSGTEPPQTATFEFRVHRHLTDSGNPSWLAIDFFRPDVSRWITDLAGAKVIYLAAGHA